MRGRMLALVLTLAVVSTIFLNASAFASDTSTIKYYDEYANEVTVNGLYYNKDGYPMYNADSYYTDAKGNSVYVGGCRAYYYDKNGNLTAGSYYYDTKGKAVTKPTSYQGGWGCGTYYYNEQGDVVNGTYYYDDFGNKIDRPATSRPEFRSKIDPPATSRPEYRGRGRSCCGW